MNTKRFEQLYKQFFNGNKDLSPEDEKLMETVQYIDQYAQVIFDNKDANITKLQKEMKKGGYAEHIALIQGAMLYGFLFTMNDISNPALGDKELPPISELATNFNSLFLQPDQLPKQSIDGLFANVGQWVGLDVNLYGDREQATAYCRSLYATLMVIRTAINLNYYTLTPLAFTAGMDSPGNMIKKADALLTALEIKFQLLKAPAETDDLKSASGTESVTTIPDDGSDIGTESAPSVVISIQQHLNEGFMQLLDQGNQDQTLQELQEELLLVETGIAGLIKKRQEMDGLDSIVGSAKEALSKKIPEVPDSQPKASRRFSIQGLLNNLQTVNPKRAQDIPQIQQSLDSALVKKAGAEEEFKKLIQDFSHNNQNLKQCLLKASGNELEKILMINQQAKNTVMAFQELTKSVPELKKTAETGLKMKSDDLKYVGQLVKLHDTWTSRLSRLFEKLCSLFTSKNTEKLTTSQMIKAAREMEVKLKKEQHTLQAELDKLTPESRFNQLKKDLQELNREQDTGVESGHKKGKGM